MKQKHILDIEVQKAEIEELYSEIYSGNSILFLGAGASISNDKKYLSKQIIDYYEAEKKINLGTDDITEFVDILSSSETFSRDEFDSYVDNLLRKLDINDAHKIITTLNWREIITTNYDLLIERAYEENKREGKTELDLKLVLKPNNYFGVSPVNELKYIKLCGCLSDKKQYPLAFSTEDFYDRKEFFNIVLKDLVNTSYKVRFIAVGYSFRDNFSKNILKKLDDITWRKGRWLYCIDPYIGNEVLDYYASNNICVIKDNCIDFFKRYKKWEENNFERLIKTKNINFTNTINKEISLDNKLIYKLNSYLIQLNKDCNVKFISDSNFYKGEEPNYSIILKDYDVILKNKLDSKKKLIIDKIHSKDSDTNFIPIIFLTGSFGTGKSTFSYRLINELIKEHELKALAFEIIDNTKVFVGDLKNLFNESNAETIILLFNTVELESVFDSLNNIRVQLSTEQFTKFSVIIIAPVRENILKKYIISHQLKNYEEINIDAPLEDDEINNLLLKLKKCRIINFRDNNEKKLLLQKIKQSYSSDSFVTLLNLVTDGKHRGDLIDAYNELSVKARKAFLYTAFLHQYNLYMPASLLREIMQEDWDSLRRNIIEVEGKNILIQETLSNVKGAEPDLYFRTKHSLISKELINFECSSRDDQFKIICEIFKNISSGDLNSRLFIDFIKYARRNEDLTTAQIDKLFDLTYEELSSEPYYLFYYVVNKQKNKNIKELKEAIDIIFYAESKFDYKNHKFIHRRATLNFDLAKCYFEHEGHKLTSQVIMYLREAEELFEIKQLLDPCSSYSFIDYLKMQIWELDNIIMKEVEKLRLRIRIEENFDLSSRSVIDRIEEINKWKDKYGLKFMTKLSEDEYIALMKKNYSDPELIPYSLILLYNYYFERGITNKCDAIVKELEYFNYNIEVVKFLFKYYGRNLHVKNIRTEFYNIVNNNQQLEKNDSLRYYYFMFISECYNFNFTVAMKYLNNIKIKFSILNPDFHSIWIDEDTHKARVFEGYLLKNTKGYYEIKESILQRRFPLKRRGNLNYNKLLFSEKYKFNLHFYLYGVVAEIVQ
jgi:hypothetical protein